MGWVGANVPSKVNCTVAPTDVVDDRESLNAPSIELSNHWLLEYLRPGLVSSK